MCNTRLVFKLFLLPVLLSSLLALPCFGQFHIDSTAVWVKRFSLQNKNGDGQLSNFILQVKTVTAKEWPSIVDAFKAKGDLSNPWFSARYYTIAACAAFNISYPHKNPLVKDLCQQALKIAYETGDQKLISEVSWRFGELMDNYNQIELAVMYCLNAAEINKITGVELNGGQNLKLGEVLYKIREYKKAAGYCKAAVPQLGTGDIWLANCLNTIGLCYQKLGLYDSALCYYDSAILFTKNYEPEIWTGIISGNRGQVYFLQGNYQEALPLFELDYRESKAGEIFDNAANSLQWAAKTNLVLGNNSLALEQLREAFYLLAKNPVKNYYQNLYQTAADVYRAAGMPDSAFYFSRQYINLHDSIERQIADSRLEISRIKLENEKNYYQVRSYQQQQQTEITRRNLVIVAVLLLALIALLYMNSLRLKTLHRQQLILEKNRNAETEIAASKQQMELFKQNLAEKSNIIEQLEQQLNDNSLTAAQREALSRLLQSTIITEEQWATFKNLHEKLFPGFFHRLKVNHPTITVAEQRMAALSKLRLSTKETAAMLGISVESVHKTRQRLKQRLSLSTENNLEDFIANL